MLRFIAPYLALHSRAKLGFDENRTSTGSAYLNSSRSDRRMLIYDKKFKNNLTYIVALTRVEFRIKLSRIDRIVLSDYSSMQELFNRELISIGLMKDWYE
jgi:hypothetical protein